MASIDEPMTDDEIEALRREMEAQRVEIREHLAAELGGQPDDYSADRYFRERTADL